MLLRSGDRFAWLRDNEFARQTLAGVNPVNIEILKVIFNNFCQFFSMFCLVISWEFSSAVLLQELPILSKLDPAVYGPPESAITKELIEEELNGMSVEKVLIR